MDGWCYRSGEWVTMIRSDSICISTNTWQILEPKPFKIVLKVTAGHWDWRVAWWSRKPGLWQIARCVTIIMNTTEMTRTIHSWVDTKLSSQFTSTSLKSVFRPRFNVALSFHPAQVHRPIGPSVYSTLNLSHCPPLAISKKKNKNSIYKFTVSDHTSYTSSSKTHTPHMFQTHSVSYRTRSYKVEILGIGVPWVKKESGMISSTSLPRRKKETGRTAQKTTICLAQLRPGPPRSSHPA